MKALFLGAVLLALSQTTFANAQTFLTGTPTLTDGDTIVIEGTSIRLAGIDAVEGRQKCQSKSGSEYRCGDASTEALRALIGNAEVTCLDIGQRSYNRVVGRCFVGPLDLHYAMVRQGWALADPKYGREFEPWSELAKLEKVGLWDGSFTYPWNWRRGERDYDHRN